MSDKFRTMANIKNRKEALLKLLSFSYHPVTLTFKLVGKPVGNLRLFNT